MEKNENKSGLSASVLKTLAVVLMVINHFSTLRFFSPDRVGVLFYIQWCVTRVSYPLFAYLLCEGMAYSKSREKYLLRLLVLAIISQPVYGWALIDGPLTTRSFNVFFDLLAGGLAIEVYDCFWKKNKVAFLVLEIALCVLSVKLAFSYAILCVLLPLLWYALRGKPGKQAIWTIPAVPVLVAAMYYIGYGVAFGKPSFFMLSELCMVGVIPFILLYNGKKGKQLPKWFSYGFYPAHLLIVGLLGLL